MNGWVLIMILKNAHYLCLRFIMNLKPFIKRPGVLSAIHFPHLSYFKFAEVREDIMRRHYPSPKEVSSHPIFFARLLVQIGCFFVAEDVNKK